METNEKPTDPQTEVLVECVKCGRRYAGPGLSGQKCPKCEGELAEIGRARDDVRPEEDVVNVYTAPDWLQAEMIREYLETEGVLIAMRSAMPWGVLSFTVDGLGEVGILALQSEADRARELIEELLQKIGAESSETDEDEEGDEEAEE